MSESLGNHLFRPLPSLPSDTYSDPMNYRQLFKTFSDWVAENQITNVIAPSWISQTNADYNDVVVTSIAVYKTISYRSSFVHQHATNYNSVIPALPDSVTNYDTEYTSVFILDSLNINLNSIPSWLNDINPINASGYTSSIPSDIRNLIEAAIPVDRDILVANPLNPLIHIWFRPYNAEFFANTRVNYRCLVNGFDQDSRTIPELPTITSSIDKNIKLSYYAKNELEPIPNLTSIYWSVVDVELLADKPHQLPIENCVMGTLVCSDADVKALIKSVPTPSGKYSYADLFPENISQLFSEWLAITPNNSTHIIRKLAATNNAWNNADLSQNNDLNVDINHPMFKIDNQRSIDWHITSQPNGSYGDLNMDSPRTIEIHAALNASQYLLETPAIVGTGTEENPQTPATHKLDWYIKNSAGEKVTAIWKALGGNKYATNLIDGTRERVTNLGYLIENLCRINGLRLNDDGEIDLVKEKDLYQPKTLNNPTLGLPDANGKYNSYGMSCYGTIGLIVPHLPTTYGAGGRATQLFDVVHDHQQLAMAILRQQDVSLSIQHGSEIRVRGLDNKIHAYPNQLAINLESLQRLEKISYLSEKNLLINTVASNEIRELFSGIGIPVTQKFLPLKDPANSKKVLSIPYFGHQKNKSSTAQMLTTVQVNLAVINGVLMPKKQPAKNDVFNPFKKFAPPKQ